MTSRVILLVASICFVNNVTGTFLQRWSNENSMDVSDFSVYYDMKTNETIRKMMPRPWYKPGWLLRLPFTGGPCKCDGFECMCCTGIRIQSVNFDRRACTKLTFEPTNSTLNMEVTMNGDRVYGNTFSARNLPPFCVPIPVPYLPPGLVDMCIRFFDVSVVEQRLHVCMDWDTRVDKAPVLVLHFDCMDMGLNGIGLSKPSGNEVNSSGSTDGTAPNQGGAEPAQMDSDIYDPVFESTPATTPYPFNNTIKYI